MWHINRPPRGNHGVNHFDAAGRCYAVSYHFKPPVVIVYKWDGAKYTAQGLWRVKDFIG